jgi:hypothetical protein
VSLLMTYRIYLVNPDGRLQLGAGFDAPDDAEAIDRAPGLYDKGHVAELWQGGRLVGRFLAQGLFVADGESPSPSPSPGRGGGG